MLKAPPFAPCVILVGGEERNIPRWMYEILDLTHVPNEKSKLPTALSKDAAAVVVLKGHGHGIWCRPSLQDDAKEFATREKIPYFVTRTANHVLTEIVPNVPVLEEYLRTHSSEFPIKAQRQVLAVIHNLIHKDLPDFKPVPVPDGATTAVPPIQITESSCGLGDDDLWEKYGPVAIEAIRTTMNPEDKPIRRTMFKEDVLRDLVGLPYPEDQEKIIRQLRLRGVIQDENGRVRIRTAEDVDYKFIQEQLDPKEQTPEPAPAPEAPAEPEPALAPIESRKKRRELIVQPPRELKTDNYMEMMLRLDAEKFYANLADFHRDLAGLGILKPDFQMYTPARYDQFIAMAKSKHILDVTRELRGHTKGWLVRILPNLPQETAGEKPVPEPVLAPEPVPVPVAPAAFEIISNGHKAEKLVEKAEISYEKTVSTFPGGKMPLLMSLKEPALAIKAILPSNILDMGAAVTITRRCGVLNPSADLLMRTQAIRKEFTDDEWLLLAFETVRDQTVGSLMNGMRQPMDSWHTCFSCGNLFRFTIGEREFYEMKGLTIPPQRCKACREIRNRESEAQNGH